MELTRALMLRIVALAAAFVLALSGVGAASTIGESAGAGNPKQPSVQEDNQGKKCKKGKKGKKCRKKKNSQKPSDEAEEAPAEGFVPGRVVEITYEGPAIGNADCCALNAFGLLFETNFIPGEGEVLAMIEIVDDVSPNTQVGFSYDSDGDGINDSGFEVCGSTEEPAETIVGTQYNLFAYLLPSTTCSDGVATRGTITVTFNKV